MSFLSALDQPGFLILDGALGTELSRRGIPIELPLWSANAVLHNPQSVRAIHQEYIEAGADIITTATFRSDPVTFAKAGLSTAQAEKTTRKAVDLAHEAIEITLPSRHIWIAGSMSPLSDCYQPKVAPDFQTALQIHRQRANWLVRGGVDFCLIETMNNVAEARAATLAALETGRPVFTSFILAENGALLSGEELFPAITELKTMGVNGIGINCTHHRTISAFLEKFGERITLPLIIYANAGIYSAQNGWRSDPKFTPPYYAKIVAGWLKKGIKIVGGCCGTTPQFIEALARLKKSPE